MSIKHNNLLNAMRPVVISEPMHEKIALVVNIPKILILSRAHFEHIQSAVVATGRQILIVILLTVHLTY